MLTPQDLRYIFGVTRNTLRFYEKKNMLKPTVIDPETGYRLYGYGEVERLHLILRYKESGMTLAEIKDYLDGKVSAYELEQELEKRLEAVRNGLDILRSQDIRENVYAVEHIVLPECVCAVEPVVWTGSEASASEFCDLLFQQKKEYSKIRHKYPRFQEWLDDDLIENAFISDSIHVNICMEADPNDPPKNAVTYPSTEAITTLHVGDYSTIDKAYKVLLDYMRDNRLVQNGHAREAYLLGPYAFSEERYVTKVMIPVRNA